MGGIADILSLAYTEEKEMILNAISLLSNRHSVLGHSFAKFQILYCQTSMSDLLSSC